MNKTRFRDRIVAPAASLYSRGLTFGSTGNISVRIDVGWLMTPTDTSMGEIDPEKIARLNKYGDKDLHQKSTACGRQ
ncbi:MAG: class II aldolase/adducin family protein [Gammaproteobacteria bacterium]|nr:class II aldolase/adducin family protein [Gammaproteobacteria bacterium]